MKAFRFRLESVLTLRNWEEERARTAYGLALQQERKFAELLRAVEARIEQDTAVLRERSDVRGARRGSRLALAPSLAARA